MSVPIQKSQRSEPGLFDVPPGTCSSPNSKLRYRLSAPLRWWSHSIARRLADEIRTFPLRILASIRAPYPRQTVRLERPNLSGCGRDASRLASTYLHSCSEDMRNLRQMYRWAGILDLQMAAEAYRMGAECAIRSLRSE